MIGMSSYDNTIPMNNDPKLSEYFGEENAETLSDIHKKHRYSIKEIDVKDRDEIAINQKL
ncbi:hypothetical protein [Velocimicrobium porci]|uniref:Uncharacterized protein n=1 Tax=Velocimicrobium porci TaxID=2606634 RepID=A0A6L5Y135_9FIRM|nr:hypothetical protein [Velocimicrobium porci]MSS64644.1 hypothetical protein [Velocimicrobium porci]